MHSISTVTLWLILNRLASLQPALGIKAGSDHTRLLRPQSLRDAEPSPFRSVRWSKIRRVESRDFRLDVSHVGNCSIPQGGNPMTRLNRPFLRKQAFLSSLLPRITRAANRGHLKSPANQPWLEPGCTTKEETCSDSPPVSPCRTSFLSVGALFRLPARPLKPREVQGVPHKKIGSWLEISRCCLPHGIIISTP